MPIEYLFLTFLSSVWLWVFLATIWIFLSNNIFGVPYGAWLDAKGTFEPEVAKRVLLEQGMDGFVAQLEKAGAL